MQWMSVANYCPVIICNQIVLAAIDVLILWITGLATIFKFRNSWFQFISLFPFSLTVILKSSSLYVPSYTKPYILPADSPTRLT